MISAQGELQASETLAQAARMLQSQPASLTLRYLQTLTEIAAENNSTTIFPIPIDFLKPFFRHADDNVAAPHPVAAVLRCVAARRRSSPPPFGQAAPVPLQPKTERSKREWT